MLINDDKKAHKLMASSWQLSQSDTLRKDVPRRKTKRQFNLRGGTNTSVIRRRSLDSTVW